MPAVAQLLAGLASPDWDIEAQLDEGKRTFTDPTTGLTLTVKVTGIYGYGRDERRMRYDDTKKQLTEEVHGQRRIKLTTRFECQEATMADWCFAYSERVRTRLRRESSLEALIAVNSSLIEIHDTVNFSAKNDDHIETISQFDLMLGAAFQDDNPFPPNSGWIDSIAYDSHVSEGGVELPVPPNVRGHVVSVT